MSRPGGESGHGSGQNQNPAMSNRGNSRPGSRPSSRPTSRQPSMTGNSQYPVPQYGNQDNQYNLAPQPVQEPDRNQQHSPANQGYATSDTVDQAQGPYSAYGQQGIPSGKTDPAIQLGAYPQGMAAPNPAYGMPDPSGYGQQQQGAAYPSVTYGGSQQGQGNEQQGYPQQGPLGQGAQQPHSHVQYPAVLYDQQHQNYAQHDPHTMPHPASAAAAAVLVAHASSLGQGGNANTKYNADGSSFTGGLNEMEQGMGQGPLGQGHGVINANPLVRQQTFGPIKGPHHASASEAFPARAGVADWKAHYTGSPGAGVEGAQQWQAVEPPPVNPLDAEGPGKRKVPWSGQHLQNINWLMAFLILCWFVITIIYIVVRATKSLKLGKATAYGVWVLVMEAAGVTTVCIYASHLMFRIRKWEPPLVRKPFSVRVMIPCYKEDIETLEETVECAIEAAKAAMAKGQTNAVHIYLCDDSPKDYKERYNGQTFVTVALRQQMIDALYQVHGIPVIRVTRVKGKGETNPKSANLNNCLKQIYGDAIPPESEVVAVFDADQAAHSHFFTSTLPWMDAGDDVALVQSPQVFRGVHWSDDVLNHENIGFWHYLQPAYNVMGFISCAGTNFLLRSAPFAQAGYFPDHTLTEDYALGMEMRRTGWREVYVEDELVRGSAPDKVRGAFGQRSRWCKGPYQMLFSKKSPLFARGLNIFFRILYLSPCYIYIVSALGTPTFMAIPIIYIWAGRFPAILSSTVISWMIAYTVLSYMIKCYVRPGRNIIHDFRSHWNAEISTKNFWWMYWKAAFRGSSSKLGCFQLGWTPGAGGGKANNCYTKLCEARGDLYPMLFFAFVITVSIVYGFFMVGAGAEFVGPLGISIIWAIYHAISPWLLIFYTILPFRHEAEKNKVYYNVGRSLFFIIVNICFLASYACFVACIVLAYETKDLGAYNSGYNNGVYHLGVMETFKYIGNHNNA